jgi:redox-sensitive bicupin YhaK (pirin superfamily)
MSNPGAHESPRTASNDAIQLLIHPDTRDLGELTVRRLLPASELTRIGPFVFFDEFGPVDFAPGQGINVRPHPHIGLATVTFLFEGEILHRDSLGSVQAIQPGAVNLMTAGRGIVHSERTSPALLRTGQSLHGIQVWMALPAASEEVDPEFTHYPHELLPVVEEPGVSTTVIIGQYAGVTSPVEVLTETLYLTQQLQAGASTGWDASTRELAVYVVSGQVNIGTCNVQKGVMAVLKSGDNITLNAIEPSRIVIIGGADVGPRNLYWNFVHTSKERIEQASKDWRDNQFPGVPGDDEFIPLPDE